MGRSRALSAHAEVKVSMSHSSGCRASHHDQKCGSWLIVSRGSRLRVCMQRTRRVGRSVSRAGRMS